MFMAMIWIGSRYAWQQLNFGNLDGIEPDGKGSYYVTDWTGAKLYNINKKGKFKVIAEVGKGAADHEVILDKNLIIIPVMAEGKVIALKVK